MKRPGDLERALLLLRDTAQAVADTLQFNNIWGVRNTVRNLNPIVRFAQRQLLIDDYRLALFHSDALFTYVLRLTLSNGVTEEVEMPAAVKAFLDAFNRGNYPGLELAP